MSKRTKHAVTNTRKHAYPEYIVLSLVIFILYGNTISNDFSLDDHFVVDDNPVVQQGISGFPEILYSRYSETDNNYQYGYRPVVLTSFAVEYLLFGINPHLSHLVNILLYLLCCVILLLIFKRIFKDSHRLLPVIITVLFAAHPVHTEVVASLKNRDEIFSLLGSLIAMLLFLRYADTNKLKYLFYGLLSYFLAYLSKPTALPYIALFPLVLYFFTGISLKRLLIVVAGVLAVYVVAQYGPELFLEPSRRPRRFYENNIRYEDIFTRFTTGMYILLFYLKKLIYPHPLLFYYGYNMIPVAGPANIWVILSMVLHGAALVYTVLRFKSKDVMAFGILFYLISMAALMNVVKPIMGIVAERFLLTPSIAFSILVVFGVFLLYDRLLKRQSIIMRLNYKITTLAVVFFIPYTALTIGRNSDWKDYFTLYSADIKHLEQSVKANDLYANMLRRKLENGEFKKSERDVRIREILQHYKQALTLYPEHHHVWFNLGSFYANILNKNEEAIRCYRKAIELYPDDADYYQNLGVAYKFTGKMNKAVANWEKAIEVDSNNTGACFFLARLYIEQNKIDSARMINDQLFRIDSLSDKPYENKGLILLAEKDTTTAMHYWEIAAKINPQNINILRSLNAYFREKNNQPKAVYYHNLFNGAVQKKKIAR